ncbi:MAG: HPr family phosphocarrier protein [Oscillospiraceae bacterium]|jgi:phosphotransferase system HPr-like phosphotransfer protein|nr:HPr family phosphocarrier protein [Oscillospiraceae bacterium]
MTAFKIFLSSIEDVKKFVALMNRQDFDADIISGKYVVDAKSILGLFSLDLSKTHEMRAYSDDCRELGEELEKYIIK